MDPDMTIYCYARVCKMSLDGPAVTVERAYFRCHSDANQPLTTILHHLAAQVAFRKPSILETEHPPPARSLGPPSPPLPTSNHRSGCLPQRSVPCVRRQQCLPQYALKQRFLSSYRSASGRLSILLSHRDLDKLFYVVFTHLALGFATGKPQCVPI